MPADPGADAAAWIRARAPQWQALAANAAAAPRARGASVAEALRTLRTYRSLARHLASTRELLPGSFLVTALSGWWLIASHPELVSLIASPRMIDGVQQGHLWTYGMLDIAPPELLSAQIFSNNAVVTLAAFCSGILFGLGAFYMIAFNGLMLGGLFAFVARYGLALALFKFILAHGPVELSVMCLAAAGGTALGEAVIWPRELTRAESVRRRAAELGPLLLVCPVLLLGSGLIEGFLSPRPDISIPVRLIVGLCYWTLMLLLLSGRLFPRPAAVAAA